MASLKELAQLIGGTVVGDESLEIRRVAPIDEAQPGDITFVANPRYLPRLAQSRASAVIAAPGVDPAGKALIVSRNPYLAFAKVLTHLQGGRPAPRGIMPGAIVADPELVDAEATIHPGCILGEGVKVGRGTVLHPGVVLYAGVEIGENCLIHAGVVVREGCRIGNRVIVQPSAVIGSDGFGFAPDGERYFKIPQVGIVVVEDDVEIGAATCIDRGTMGVTRIGRGVKIDNLVQIAHNVTVGEDTIIVSQVGISGSTRIGRHCTFGGQSAAAGHLRIADNTTIGARGGVSNNVTEPNQVLSGVPVIPHKDWLKAAMTFTRLPEMRKELQHMRRRLEELEAAFKEE